MFRSFIPRSVALAGAVALLAVGTFAVNTSADHLKKSYTPTITASKIDGTTSAFHAGSVRDVTFQLTNTSANNISFSAANFFVEGITYVGTHPATPTLSASTAQPSDAIATWETASADTGNLQLRNLSVPRNGTVTVTGLRFRVPCNAATPSQITTDIRQANNFNGTDNTFKSHTPVVAITVVGTCKLAFTTQPSDVELPAKATATVTAQDGGGDAITDWAIPIGVAVTPSTTVTGSTSVAPTLGVSNFELGLPTGSYTLVASSVGLVDSDPSSSFVVAPKSRFDCVVEGDACSTGDLTGPDDNLVKITLDDLGNEVTATLVVKIKSADEATADCSAKGYNPADRPLLSEVDFTVIPATDDDATKLEGLKKTVVYTIKGAARDAATYNVCFQAPYDFPAADLSGPYTFLDDINSGDFSGNTIVGANPASYTGILLNCNQPTNNQINSATPASGSTAAVEQTPCVVSRADVGSDVVITVIVPAKDPLFRAG